MMMRDWVSLPGGELEAPRVRTLCDACRERAKRPAAAGVSASPQALLCFGCYRSEQLRERKLKAAGALHTASEARFQCTLPFEPVNHSRLTGLRAARQQARVAGREGAGQFSDRRRQAQIAARHALQRIGEGLKARGISIPERHPTIAAAVHAAELQLPDAWLPFVVSR